MDLDIIDIDLLACPAQGSLKNLGLLTGSGKKTLAKK